MMDVLSSVPNENRPMKQNVQSQKGKATTLVDDQPQDAKRLKVKIVKTRKLRPDAWTAKADVALLEAVNSHGLDFERIKSQYGARLGYRKARNIRSHFRQRFPDRFKELNTGAMGRSIAWTTEEDTALLEAIDEHGLDFDRIKTEYGARLGDRSKAALSKHLRKHFPARFKEAKKAAAQM